MKKRTVKALKLSKETVRSLEGSELGEAKGASVGPVQCSFPCDSGDGFYIGDSMCRC
jgi:hypothetical protein